MKKPILITFLCAGLMLVTPFSVVARENKISSNLTDEPDIEGLVAELRVVIDEILQTYGHIPMVSNLFNRTIGTLCYFKLTIILAIIWSVVYFIVNLLIDLWGIEWP